MNAQDFLRMVLPPLGRALPGTTPRAEQLIIAHAASESGWGSSRAARLGNNLFNLTRVSADKRAVVTGGDLEYDKAGNVKPITQRFRAYASLQEGFADYWRFLGANRYLEAKRRLIAGDAGFVESLGPDRAPLVGGFYTLPTAEYVRSYTAVLESVKRAMDAPPVA